MVAVGLAGAGAAALADTPAKPKATAPPPPPASASASASAVPESAPPAGGHAPDPAGTASRKQWLFDVVVRGGKARVARADAVMIERAATTARVMGRFAIELYIGKELLDRIRFNVPLTGDERDMAGVHTQKHRRPFAHPSFDDVTTRLRVQLADNPRATYAQLVDRATGETQQFWWPPEPDGKLVPRVVAEPTPRTKEKTPPSGGTPKR